MTENNTPDYGTLYRMAKPNLRLDTIENTDNKLLVDLTDARGDYRRDRLLSQFDIIGNEGLPEESLNTSKYVLFGGHMGCGKNTELRFIETQMNQSNRYFTVMVNILKEVDHNNLQYSDLLLALVKKVT